MEMSEAIQIRVKNLRGEAVSQNQLHEAMKVIRTNQHGNENPLTRALRLERDRVRAKREARAAREGRVIKESRASTSNRLPSAYPTKAEYNRINGILLKNLKAVCKHPFDE
jgi:hypothetical protein